MITNHKCEILREYIICNPGGEGRIDYIYVVTVGYFQFESESHSLTKPVRVPIITRVMH